MNIELEKNVLYANGYKPSENRTYKNSKDSSGSRFYLEHLEELQPSCLQFSSLHPTRNPLPLKEQIHPFPNKSLGSAQSKRPIYAQENILNTTGNTSTDTNSSKPIPHPSERCNLPENKGFQKIIPLPTASETVTPSKPASRLDPPINPANTTHRSFDTSSRQPPSTMHCYFTNQSGVEISLGASFKNEEEKNTWITWCKDILKKQGIHLKQLLINGVKHDRSYF